MLISQYLPGLRDSEACVCVCVCITQPKPRARLVASTEMWFICKTLGWCLIFKQFVWICDISVTIIVILCFFSLPLAPSLVIITLIWINNLHIISKEISCLSSLKSCATDVAPAVIDGDVVLFTLCSPACAKVCTLTSTGKQICFHYSTPMRKKMTTDNASSKVHNEKFR